MLATSVFASDTFVDFNIPSQSLSSALVELSQQADINIFGVSQHLKDIQSPELNGRFTTKQALNVLLECSGLTYKISDNGSIYIRPPDSAKPDVLAEEQFEELFVIGYRSGLRSAFEVKGNADSIIDVVFAHEIGKFPDGNIAESLQRVPGIAITRTIGGEGQFVTVRGVGQQYNLVTLNGRTLPTDNEGRDFSFDIVPSEMVARVDVIKTPKAEVIEGGIGAIVDMKTLRPLDQSNITNTFSMGGVYDEGQERWGNKVSGVWQMRFGDNLGVAIGGVYSERFWRADLAQSLERRSILTSEGDVFKMPGIWGYAIKQGKRQRASLSGALQYRSDNFEVVVDGFYSNYRTPETASYLLTNFMELDAHQLLDDRSENGALTEFYVENTPVEFAIDPKNRVVQTFQFGTNVSWDLNDQWQLSTDISTSSVNRPEGGKQKFWVAGIEGANIRYRARERVPEIHVSLPPLLSGANRRNLSEYTNDDLVLRSMDSKGDDIEDELNAYRISARYFVRDNVNLSLGISLDSRKKVKRVFNSSDRDAYKEFGIHFSEFSIDAVEEFPVNDFLSDYSERFPTQWPVLSETAIWQTALSSEGVSSSEHGNIVPVGLHEEILPVFDARGSSDIEESVRAVFGQISMSGSNWDGNIGFRYTQSSITSKGATQDFFDQNGIVLSGDKIVASKDRYENFLPSMNFVYRLTRGVHVRLSASKTMTRPPIDSLGVNEIWNDPRTRLTRFGQTNLKPITSNQFDFSVDVFGDENQVSLGVFYKDIEGFITTRVSREIILGNGITVEEPVNGDAAEVAGLEISANTVFRSGFGTQINATYADSHVHSFGHVENHNALEGLSKYTFNLVGFYENHTWSARLAYNFRDKFVNAVESQGGDPEITDSFATLDLSISYSVSDDVDVYLDMINVLEEALYSYSVEKNRPLNFEAMNRRSELGVRFTF